MWKIITNWYENPQGCSKPNVTQELAPSVTTMVSVSICQGVCQSQGPVSPTNSQERQHHLGQFSWCLPSRSFNMATVSPRCLDDCILKSTSRCSDYDPFCYWSLMAVFQPASIKVWIPPGTLSQAAPSPPRHRKSGPQCSDISPERATCRGGVSNLPSILHYSF